MLLASNGELPVACYPDSAVEMLTLPLTHLRPLSFVRLSRLPNLKSQLQLLWSMEFTSETHPSVNRTLPSLCCLSLGLLSPLLRQPTAQLSHPRMSRSDERSARQTAVFSLFQALRMPPGAHAGGLQPCEFGASGTPSRPHTRSPRHAVTSVLEKLPSGQVS